MSFFNLDIPNEYHARFKKIIADDFYQRNYITNEYERVGSGGGGPGTIPYYLKANDIEMNNELTGTGTVLNDNSLIIGDSAGNETLNKDKIKILTQLKTNIVDVNITNYQNPFPVGYNKTTSNFERLSRISIGTYNQYSDVAQTGIKVSQDGVYLRMTSTNINLINGFANYALYKEHFKSITQIQDNIVTPDLGTGDLGKYIVSYNKNTDLFERAANITFGTTNTNSQYGTTGIIVNNFASKVELYWNLLRFTASGITYDLKKEDITTVNNLKSATTSLPTTNSKMLMIDSVTKNFTYTTIPTSYTPAVMYKVIEAGFFTRVILTNYYSKTYIFPVGDTQPLFTYTNAMNTGDKLVLVSQNADSTKLIKTNNWYVIKLTNNTADAIDAKFTFDVFPEAGPISGQTMSGDYKIRFRRISPTANDGATPFPAVVPANSIMFSVTEETNDKYAMIDSTAILSYRDYDVAKPFYGTIIINCITSDYKTGNICIKHFPLGKKILKRLIYHFFDEKSVQNTCFSSIAALILKIHQNHSFIIDFSYIYPIFV